jgi:hypothetical protein
MMANLIEIIKKASMDAVMASRPVGVVYGVVVSASPLRIQIDQKITVDKDFLILTQNVTDYEIEMTLAHFTERDADLITTHAHPSTGTSSFDSSHKHEIQGKKKITVHNKLKTGDKVLMLSQQGGQSYVVIDKVVSA